MIPLTPQRGILHRSSIRKSLSCYEAMQLASSEWDVSLQKGCVGARGLIGEEIEGLEGAKNEKGGTSNANRRPFGLHQLSRRPSICMVRANSVRTFAEIV